MADCGICYEPYGDFRRPACYPCGHVLCLQCVGRLQKLGCPICHWKPSSSRLQKLQNDKGISNYDFVTRLFMDLPSPNKQAKLEVQIATLKKENRRLRENLQIVSDALVKERVRNAAKVERLRDELETEQKDNYRLRKKVKSVLPALKRVTETLTSVWEDDSRESTVAPVHRGPRVRAEASGSKISESNSKEKTTGTILGDPSLALDLSQFIRRVCLTQVAGLLHPESSDDSS